MVDPVPLVSVVIPTRDRPAFARRAVASALAQRDVKVEVLLVDDGSREPVHSDREGVRVVRHPASRGVAAARNGGAALAKGHWLAFLDDDDFWAPEKLAVQLEVAQRDGASFVYSGALVVEGGKVVNVHPSPPAAEVKRLIRRANVIPAGASNVLVEADLFRNAGGFSSELQHLADWDLWSRLLADGAPGSVAELHVAYVHHPSSMHIAEIGSIRSEGQILRRLHRTGPIEAFDAAQYAWFIAEGQRQAGRHWRAASIHGAAALRHRDGSHLKSAAVEALHAAGIKARRERRDTPPAWVSAQWDGSSRG